MSGTNDVSFLKFSTTQQSQGTAHQPETQNDAKITVPIGQDADKQAQVKANVIKKLASTPEVAGTNLTASAGVTIPIGQPSSPPVDRFSAEGVAAAIEGYDEVKDDKDVKSALAQSKWNPVNWFKGGTQTIGNEKLTDAGLTTLTKADLAKMDKSNDEIAKHLDSPIFDEQKATQGGKADKKDISLSEHENSMDKMKKFQTEQANIMKILADPNATKAQKDDAMKKLDALNTEATKMFESTPKTENDKPVLTQNTQAKLDTLSPKEQAETKQYLQSSLNTGIDSDDAGYVALSKNSQAAIASMAADIKIQHPEMH